MRSAFAKTVYVVTLRLPDILSTVRDLPLRRRRIKDTGEQELRQLNFVGRNYPPTPAALCGPFTGQKRRARPDPPGPPANHRAPGPTPHGPAVSGLGRLRRLPKTRGKVGFLAGHEPPDRRPVGKAPARSRAPRPEDGAATGHRRRDAWCWRRAGDDPGPAGACCQPGGGWPNATRWTKPFV